MELTTTVTIAAPPEGTRLTPGIVQTGPGAGLTGLLSGARTRRSVQMEADGLKAAAEAAA